MDLANTLTPPKNWGGVMKPLSVSAINLAKENINFIEIWMQVEKAPPDGSGKMIIDLGAVSSEDVIPNRGSDPNSEDLVLSAYPNGTLQEGEDVGLDMLTDVQERAEHAALVAQYPELAGDPSGDDYYFNNQTVNTAARRLHATSTGRKGTRTARADAFRTRRI